MSLLDIELRLTDQEITNLWNAVSKKDYTEPNGEAWKTPEREAVEAKFKAAVLMARQEQEK